jgi:tRNA A-37 threonylcarbamoyl transferase component Bud32
VSAANSTQRLPESIRAGAVRWRFAPHAAQAGYPVDLPVPSWLASGTAHIVKSGAHRVVYRVDLPESPVYLKHDRGVAWWHRWLGWLRTSPSRREWVKAQEIARRNVPTITAVAYGQVVSGPAAGESFFISRAIQQARALDEFIVCELPALERAAQARTRRQLVDRLAHLLAQVHRAGIDHDDLHIGNLLARVENGEIQLHVIDVPNVRLGRPLGWRRSQASLVMLASSFRYLATRAEKWRFWRTYLVSRPEFAQQDRKAAFRQMQSNLQRYLASVYRSRDKRALASNRDYIRLRAAGTRANAVQGVGAAQLQRFAADPHALIAANLHKPIKLARSSWLVEGEMEIDGRLVAVGYKRHQPVTWRRKLASRLVETRARRAWRAGHALLARGIATPRPLLMCETSNRASYLATEWIVGAINLHHYCWELSILTPIARRQAVRAAAATLGALIGELHLWGFVHRDLKASNIIVAPQDSEIRAYLVDLDGLRQPWRCTERLVVRNLARLAVSFDGYDWIGRAAAVEFLRCYLRAARRPQADLPRIWRAVNKAAERLRRRMRRRGRAVL